MPAAVRGASPTGVVDLEAARASKRRPAVVLASPRGWTALAASVVVGLIVGHFAFQRSSEGVLELDTHGVVAGPALAAALARRLASDPPSADGIALGLSFRSKGGAFCRTFSVAQQHGLAGVACHEADRWQIGTLSEHATASGDPGAYRQAATSLAPAIRDAVSATIDGEPFDSEAERLAQRRGWR